MYVPGYEKLAKPLAYRQVANGTKKAHYHEEEVADSKLPK